MNCKKMILITMLFCANLGAKEWISEDLYDSWRQTFSVDEKLYEEQTEEQHLVLFKNNQFGKVLVLDGVIQITEKDEFPYQEMMVHVPLLAHGSVQKVLIVGGGDGGILREVLRHRDVQEVVLVEIDRSVIDFSKKFLPEISRGSFDDPRVRILIEDGSLFAQQTEERFDAIICDSTDPIGPGKVLFSEEFYKNCHGILKEGGVLVNQNGVPFMQPEELTLTIQGREKYFRDVGFYLTVVPTYVGGYMALGWATDNESYRNVPVEELARRMGRVQGELKYYTPAIHKAAFVLPKFIADIVQASPTNKTN